MQFPYKKFKLADGTELLKPIIPIGLLLNKRLIRYEALIDSGADFNIFNAEIGELLGINIPFGKKMKFSGIAGEPFEVYLHNLTLDVGGWQYKIMAGFSYEISPYGFGILGQRGFFDLFRVKFIFSKRYCRNYSREGLKYPLYIKLKVQVTSQARQPSFVKAIRRYYVAMVSYAKATEYPINNPFRSPKGEGWE